MSIKSLIRKLRRTTIIIRVEAMTSREREVIDLTGPSRDPSADPKLAPSPVIAKSQQDRSERESSATLSPTREATPTLSELYANGAEAELPGSSATSKGKGPRRSPSPDTSSRTRSEATSGSSSGIAWAGPSNSSSTSIPQPTSPKRTRSVTPVDTKPRNKAPSPPKRNPDPANVIVIKDEPRDSNVYKFRRPSTPPMLKKEEDSSGSDDEGPNNDNDDPIQISPFKKCRSSPDIDLFAIPIASSFQRSSSPSPPSPGGPFRHPDFPRRPPLKCPTRKHDPVVIEEEPSKTIRNLDRRYFKCRDCPGYGGFICWADTRGIRPDNPRCWCGHAAREDITGDNSRQPDTLWYKCATDTCKYRRYDWDDPLTADEVNRYCGQEVYPM
ncbi:hypothetical protein F4677DRAFT_112752 [Hypoxylon crocopeplum]|nr:hypothetical protein F4677DRAFT_112752 [Hypoxylon crocopeplum]